ncbi:MAG: adenosine kinase [Hyphomicrobiales bacterium]
MTTKKYQVLGIGNAIVDILAKVEDDFITTHDLTKGSMALIDAERALYLSGQIQDSKIRSGGSAGNTIAGLADLGSSTAFFGKVADDDMGKQYYDDMVKLGVHFPTASIKEKEPTARSIIAITPDGERTMNTYLGACTEIGPEDMDDGVIRASQVIYFEGYLWDPPRAKDALRRAAEIAHEADGKVALTLSDSFCVDRYRDEFRELIQNRTVDIVLANEDELLSLFESNNFDGALRMLAAECSTAAITRGEKGAIVLDHGKQIACKPFPTSNVIDTTGAGDMFAAGYLYGLTNDMSHENAGRLGCLLASQVIQVVGPRLDSSLRQIASKAGFEL